MLHYAFVFEAGEERNVTTTFDRTWLRRMPDYQKRKWFKASGYEYVYAMTDFGLFDSRRKQL